MSLLARRLLPTFARTFLPATSAPASASASVAPLSGTSISSRNHHAMAPSTMTANLASEGGDPATGREILPANVRPSHYALKLRPNLEKFTFRGSVDVNLDILQDSKEITLNTIELSIHSAAIDQVAPTDIAYNEDLQRATLTWDKVWKAGEKKTLSIEFDGTLNDKMAGFYRSRYKDEQGNLKYIATTQMEPTDARRAFPCWDEPALKATFDITLVSEDHYTHLSNMDIKKESTESGIKTTSFNATPIMSTYLLAFIVGELRYIETNNFRVPVRVYANPGLEHQGKFSLELAAKTLAFYEKVFDIPYPLPHMQMVAIGEFSAGAMENYGLVTYREVDLLLDEDRVGAATKERVAEVVQHELAHQWFGNLVTMDFWEGLWLNEGFATAMSWYSCDHFYPEWKVWQTYVTDNLQSALRLDGLRSSHPIEVPVKRADEINQIFDAISYSKGSCVLRMLSKYLGEDTFNKGVSRYLKRHAYGNTKTSDLWAALSEESGKDVVRVMELWTKKVGYPVITVSETDDAVTIRQNRFLVTNDVKPEEDETLYWVPLGLKTLQNGKPVVDEQLEFNKRETTISLGKAGMGFYKFNTDSSGFYRTNYSPDRLRKIAKTAVDSPGVLSVEDRAGLVADVGALASAGYGKTSSFLSLVDSWTSENSFVVWSEMLDRVGALRSAWVFQSQDVRDALEAFQRHLTSRKAHQLGWTFHKDDDHVESQFKSLMFGSAGIAGDEDIKKAAFDMFNKFAAGSKEAIHPNIKKDVFAIALKYGGEKEYQIIIDTYLNPQTNDEKNTALRSIGRASDPKLIQRTLDFVFSQDVKQQDIYMPLIALRVHPEGIRALWAWAKQNWDEIVRLLPPGLSMLSTVASVVTSSFTSHKDMEDIQAFFKHKSTKGFDQAIAQSLDSIRAKSQWIDRDTRDVEQYLAEEGYLSKGKL